MARRPNPHAVALGRKGGHANTSAQAVARARNGRLSGGRPTSYRSVDDKLKRWTDGRWLTLERPYDAAARAYLRRHRG